MNTATFYQESVEVFMLPVNPIQLNQSHPGARLIAATAHCSLLHREYLL